MSKIREKESLECGRMHIWALKTQKLPGPLSGPWTPAANCSLRSRDSALLRRQLSASTPGAPPLDQILDPHLDNYMKMKEIGPGDAPQHPRPNPLVFNRPIYLQWFMASHFNGLDPRPTLYLNAFPVSVVRRKGNVKFNSCYYLI